MPQCLICRGKLEAVAEGISASTSRADVLYPVNIYKCSVCEHLQKENDVQYQNNMRDVYENNYELPAGYIKVVDGKIVYRLGSLVQNLIKLLKLGKSGRVLDVGTGNGHLCSAFAAELKGWDIVGHDLNNAKEADIRAGGATEFYAGNLDSVPGKYDLITLHHVLEHVTEPVDLLKQAAALLKEDGHLVVIVPCCEINYTDFFFMEHVSHFSPKSLNVAACLAGLEIINPMDGLLGFVEIGFIARHRQKVSHDFPVEALRWAQSLPGFIRGKAQGKPINIFGLNGAGMWLAAMLKGEITFIVDDSPEKQGIDFAGAKVVSVNDIPEGDTVFVTYNNPEASLKMSERLKSRRPGVNFVVPPKTLA